MEQLKLFSFGEEPKKKRPGLFIPVDILVLSGVVFLLLLGLTYFLGIEKGRHYAMAPMMMAKRVVQVKTPVNLPQDGNQDQNQNQNPAPASDRVPAAAQAVATAAKPAQRPLEYASLPADKRGLPVDKRGLPVGQAGLPTRSGNTDLASSRYTIQVASYKGQAPAMREIQKLQQIGQSVNVSQKGDYWVIYVGNYDVKAEANKNAAQLKIKYGECFVRRL
jgi:cell division protein FtsN